MAPSTPATAITTQSVSFHSVCWATISRATGAGCPPVSYLIPGEAVPAGCDEISCLVCGDRWVLASGSGWLRVLRRAMLAVALGVSDAA